MPAKRLLALFLVFFGVTAPVAFAQGAQTGTVSGVIRSTDELPLPGATVTATSPDLQGSREAVTDANGVYFLHGLAPGAYRIEIVMPGFQPAVRPDVQVRVGGSVDVDAVLPVAGITETVTVTAPAPSPAANPGTAQTYKKADVDALPVGRRPTDVAELAPGVTTNVFNAGQLDARRAASASTTCSWSTASTSTTTCRARRTTCSSRTPSRRRACWPTASRPSTAASPAASSTSSRAAAATSSAAASARGSSNPAWIVETPLQKAGRAGERRASSARRTRARSAGRSCATASGSSPPAAARRRTCRTRSRRTAPPTCAPRRTRAAS